MSLVIKNILDWIRNHNKTNVSLSDENFRPCYGVTRQERKMIMEDENMKDMFEKVKKTCQDTVEEYGENASYFKEGATEQEIIEWETKTGVKMPESYREWLLITKECRICGSTASFYFPDVEQPSFVPEDYIVIGEVVGDGELVCFSKTSKKFEDYFEGNMTEEYSDFREVLDEAIRFAKGEGCVLSKESEELLLKMSQAAEERERENR